MADKHPPTADVELWNHVDRVLNPFYELDREIGRGGMGIVYLARDRRLKRQVAIKLLPPELSFRSEIRSRFLREAETAAQLGHPHIVPIYSVDEREGLVYFVMAYVDGDNLAVRLHKTGALPADETRRVLLEVSRALDYAHERGVIHRDIKPDNILMSAEDGRVMVTDFGIARAVTDGADSRLTATGMAIGTPAYMSPEQSMGEREIDGRSDLYALGVVGYQMLTGELPFQASSTPALLVKQISERPPSLEARLPTAPVDLCRAIMLLLEKDPAHRFPSASALAAALEARTAPPPAPSALPAARALAGTAAPRAEAPAIVAPDGLSQPTADELARWDAYPVRQFRKKLAPFFSFSAVAVVLAIFDVINVTPVAGIWSIFIAFQYAKLWSENYDWRDVFKQPRDRMFFDVVAEWMDSVRALWDKRKASEVRERNRLRGARGGLFARSPLPGSAAVPGSRAADLSPLLGAGTAAQVREGQRNRDEILRLYDTLSKQDRELMAEVPATANALYERVESLSVQLAEAERAAPADAVQPIDAEIRRLEGEANPLDTQRSEERVRRLAYLKRQRRAVAELGSRRERAKDKLDRCLTALQNMRLDVLRLKAGGQSVQQVTLVAEKAMALAREVEAQVYAADEISKLQLGGSRGLGAR